ncbi:glycosyltransferase family 2 protein [Sphingosinicella sp. BN140058]|uniref:glycosyltransferase family 2 protein n=1 Tax=Sphingosinicella sp. BN140058 TaxID=1892855 RepID=UPI001011B46A|nr:glycosyltransferase family 2 protein [Sphingosinicella sp. BN140058]QAY77676.1 glycosyltransferase family 2 protein [Sphingosinicella sp. BN140058]
MTLRSDDDTNEGRSAPAAPTTSRTPVIEVALATWQGERFLAEQLDSLFAQTDQNFTLLVADDGSRDATVAILEDYSARYPNRIRVVERAKQSSGALGNFARLIDRASADYLMFCDHDDIWLPNKIALTRQRMSELEDLHGKATPLLVHTDLAVVDEHLQVIGPSFFRYSRIDPSRNGVVGLLTANVATGCTILANRALYEKARPIAPEAMMHDHWLALVAANFGVISWVDEPTILYRQHGRNAIGAKSGGTASLIHRVTQTLFSDDRERVMRRYSGQAAAFLARYGDEMTPAARRATEALATIWSTSRWRRFGRLRRNGLGLSGFVRNAALFVVVTRSKGDRGYA